MERALGGGKSKQVSNDVLANHKLQQCSYEQQMIDDSIGKIGANWKATIVANTRGAAGRRRKGQQVEFRGEKRECYKIAIYEVRNI